MDLRETLYYLRQYKEYNKAGIVPDVTCNECDIPYVPRIDSNTDEIVFWCYQCDREMRPGMGIINRMIEYVKKIEE